MSVFTKFKKMHHTDISSTEILLPRYVSKQEKETILCPYCGMEADNFDNNYSKDFNYTEYVSI